MTRAKPMRGTNRASLSRNLLRLPTAVCLGGILLAALCLSAARAATLQIGTTNVVNGASFSVPVTIDSGTNALGGYVLTIAYSSNALAFTSVSGGNGAFAAA